ncbi:exo-alpha-sialidase [Synechococcus sp. UW69]|uniref:exo-alpha-sialidase n=1 Tax=Synechococcus sp. UW69 TaxID=368493 RepID=UPI000E0F3905|nr:exo-alpha-sialidase [Synechococcus sp. UW69]
MVPPFSSFDQAEDRFKDMAWGQVLVTPFELGAWALLEPMGEQNHAPQLCWIRPDLLGCVWMAGTGEGTAGMSVFLSLLGSEGGCWSEPQKISKDVERSEQNPLLFVSDRCLHLIHSAQLVRNPADRSNLEASSSFSMQWTAVLRHQRLALEGLDPADPGTWLAEAWSPPADLFDDPAFCRNPPYPLENGNWLLPIYRSLEAGGAFGHDHSEMVRLDSSGQCLDQPFGIPESTGRVHGSVVASRDGKELLQFFRSRLADQIYRSVSTDDGVTWSAPVPTLLPNNNSSIQACRLESGRLAMIFNRFGLAPDPAASGEQQEWGEARWPRTRWPLSIAISDDDGLHWPWIRDIDTGFGFCGPMNWDLNGQLAYPTLIEGRPGELHVAYSWAGRQAIRYVTLRELEVIGYALDASAFGSF